MNLSELNDLDFSTAGSWPLPFKVLAVVLVVAAVGAMGYYLFLSNLYLELESSRQQETQLRQDYRQKRQVTANIESYQKQLEQLCQRLDTMLGQLPTRTEMPDLLEDISNLGRINGLNFELFQPKDELPRDFYAAKPIAIRARGTYHQFSAFVSSVSALQRIVTLEEARLENPNRAAEVPAEGNPSLTVQATLQTYRYMDEGFSETEDCS